jgi:hypothetical protein
MQLPLPLLPLLQSQTPKIKRRPKKEKKKSKLQYERDPRLFHVKNEASSPSSSGPNMDYLPLGGHLLPADYQEYIRTWNKAIADHSGVSGDEGWLGDNRKAYRRDFPDLWRSWLKKAAMFSKLYPEHVAAVKAYQKEEQEEDE